MISYVHASSYLRQPKQKKKGTFLFFFCHEKVIKQKIITNLFCPKQQTKKKIGQALLFGVFLKIK